MPFAASWILADNIRGALMDSDQTDNEHDKVEFVSEPIEPEAGSFSTEMMVQGLAALPGAFTWRGNRYEIVECLSHSKLSAREGHSATGERYMRRQQFVVKLDTGQTATIYIERHAKPGRVAGGGRKRQRWYLYTLGSDITDDGGELA